MIFRFFFKRMSLQKQADFMRKRGIILGTRYKDGRQLHMYMYRDLFAEILYKDDKEYGEPEAVLTISGLDEFSDRLENEILKK